MEDKDKEIDLEIKRLQLEMAKLNLSRAQASSRRRDTGWATLKWGGAGLALVLVVVAVNGVLIKPWLEDREQERKNAARVAEATASCPTARATLETCYGNSLAILERKGVCLSEAYRVSWCVDQGLIPQEPGDMQLPRIVR